MVNMRERSEILYWYLVSKKNTKNSFETLKRAIFGA
jgi:hypothetical protein